VAKELIEDLRRLLLRPQIRSREPQDVEESSQLSSCAPRGARAHRGTRTALADQRHEPELFPHEARAVHRAVLARDLLGVACLLLSRIEVSRGTQQMSARASDAVENPRTALLHRMGLRLRPRLLRRRPIAFEVGEAALGIECVGLEEWETRSRAHIT